MKLLTRIQARINSLHSEEEGATAVEYGLMVSLIAMAILAGVALVGTNLQVLFNAVGLELVL
jgi:pilus assembly protein Flp/PilA